MLEVSREIVAAWSTLIGRGRSRLCSNWLDFDYKVHSVATPAFLYHEDTAQGTQRYSLPNVPAAFGRNIHRRVFAVSLWHKVGFQAQKGSIIGHTYSIKKVMKCPRN